MGVYSNGSELTQKDYPTSAPRSRPERKYRPPPPAAPSSSSSCSSSSSSQSPPPPNLPLPPSPPPPDLPLPPPPSPRPRPPPPPPPARGRVPAGGAGPRLARLRRRGQDGPAGAVGQRLLRPARDFSARELQSVPRGLALQLPLGNFYAPPPPPAVPPPPPAAPPPPPPPPRSSCPPPRSSSLHRRAVLYPRDGLGALAGWPATRVRTLVRVIVFIIVGLLPAPPVTLGGRRGRRGGLSRRPG